MKEEEGMGSGRRGALGLSKYLYAGAVSTSWD